MINFHQARIEKAMVHHIPMRDMSSGPNYSQELLNVSDETLSNTLLTMFCKCYKEPEFYSFKNLEDNSNVMFSLLDQVFNGSIEFVDFCKEAAFHLFRQSDHASIKDGYFFASSIRDLLIEDEMLDAIAMVKLESKENFLQIQHDKHAGIELQLMEGYYPGKIDKACIIFNTGREEGYKLLNINKLKPGEDAVYWTEKFLDVRKQFNDYQKTKVYMQTTRQFLDERLKPMYELEKTDEASVMHSSKDYFNRAENFNESNYLDSLFGTEEDIKDEFRQFKNEIHGNSNELNDNFKVSEAAVKKHSRIFRSVIKLDRNFHIYVHGNREKIEKGTDDSGRKYYKLYFDEES